MPLLLGIDGGGTKTVAWLARLDDAGSLAVVGRGQAGPGNPRAVGFEMALGSIDAAIAAAFGEAGLPRNPVASACLGLAGAGREAEQRQIIAWAESRNIATLVRVTGDAEPILAAVSPENVGIALIGGTGSLAWGRNAAGRTARCGGWGYLVGDEGSAYRIAHAGLTAVFRAADGRGQPTALLEAFTHHFGASSAEALIQHVYAPDMTRQRLANLAPLVFAAAATDAVAAKIVSAAADDLAELVATLAGRLGFQPGEFMLALTGGVFLHQPAYREDVFVRLDQRGMPPQSVTLVESPAAGAVALARQALRSS